MNPELLATGSYENFILLIIGLGICLIGALAVSGAYGWYQHRKYLAKHPKK